MYKSFFISKAYDFNILSTVKDELFELLDW